MANNVRVTLLVIGKIFLIILFILSFYAVGILDVWMMGIPVYWLVVPITGLIIYPVITKYFPKRWRRIKKVGVTVASYVLLLLVFQGINVLVDYGRGEKIFNYRFGNTFGPLKFVVQNPAGQHILKRVYGFLPFTSQMIVLALEDSKRCIRMRGYFVPERNVERFCPKLNSPECIIDIYKKSSRKSPYGSTGEVLTMAIGAMVVSDWKKSFDENISDTEKNYVMIKGALYIAELQFEIAKSINRDRIKSDFIEFPIEKLLELPKPFIEELEKISDDEERVSGIYEKMGLDKDKIGSDVVELYLVKRLNDSILSKFQKVGSERINILLKGVKEKIEKRKLRSKDRKDLQRHFLRITGKV